MLLSLKSLAFYSHDGGNKEDQLQMPFVSKLLMVSLRSPKGSLGYLTSYMRKRKSIPGFSSLTFCICFSSLSLSILCPLWPTVCSISTSQVRPAHPRIAFLNVPSFIFSSWATLMTFNCNFLKQTRTSLFMGAYCFWSSLKNTDVTFKVLNDDCDGFPLVAIWTAKLFIQSEGHIINQ